MVPSDNDRAITEDIKLEINFYKELASEKIDLKELKKEIIKNYREAVSKMLASNFPANECIEELDAILEQDFLEEKDKLQFRAHKLKFEKRLSLDQASIFAPISKKEISEANSKFSSLLKKFKETISQLNSIRVNNISPMTIEDVIINDSCLNKFNQDLSHGTALTNPFINLTRLVMELLDLYNEKVSNPNSSMNYDELVEKHFKSIFSLLTWFSINISTSFFIKNAQVKPILTAVGFIFDFIITLLHLNLVQSRHQIEKYHLKKLTKTILQKKYAQFSEDIIMHYIERKCYDEIFAFKTFDEKSFKALQESLKEDEQFLLNEANEHTFRNISLNQEQFKQLVDKIQDLELRKKFFQFEAIRDELDAKNKHQLDKYIQEVIKFHENMLNRHTREVKYIKWSLYLNIVFFLCFTSITGFFGAINFSSISYLQDYFVLSGAILGTGLQILAAILESYEKIEQEKDPNMIFALQISLVSNIASQFIFPALSITTNLLILPSIHAEISNYLVLAALLLISKNIVTLLKTISLYYEIKLTHQLSDEDQELFKNLKENYRVANQNYLKLSQKSPEDPELLSKKQELSDIEDAFIESYKHVYAKEISFRKIPAEVIRTLAMMELFLGITLAEYFPSQVFSESFTHTIGFNPTIYITILIFLILNAMAEGTEDHYLNITKMTNQLFISTDEGDSSPQPIPS